MNQLMLLVVALVIFVYFGGKYVPAVLKQNKEVLLGGVIGLVLCSFMGLRLEGIHMPGHVGTACVDCKSAEDMMACLAADGMSLSDREACAASARARLGSQPTLVQATGLLQSGGLALPTPVPLPGRIQATMAPDLQ